MKILHISDLHIHHEKKNNEALLRRMRIINGLFPEHTLLITGDITDDGRPDQREEAKNLLKWNRLLLTPGNHDYGSLGNEYDEADAKAFDTFADEYSCGPFFQKIPDVVVFENTLFIQLNSNIKTKNPFDFACGELGNKQLGLLNKTLIDPEYKEMIKVVSLHHHPFIHSDPMMELLDAKAFIRTVFNKIDLLLFGHKHEQGLWFNKAGIQAISAAPAFYETNLVTEILIVEKEIKVNLRRIL